MDYDVQMVAIQAPGSENGQSNFDFANEAGDKVFKTTLKPSIALTEKSLRGMDIRKIIVWYQQSDAFMLSLQFFDAEGKQLLETGWKEGSRKSHHKVEIKLEEGERICGIKGRQREGSSACWHDV